MIDKAAILIVNGGQDPKEGKWIKLCIGKIQEYTDPDKYHCYVWNNNTDDTQVVSFLRSTANTTLIQAKRNEVSPKQIGQRMQEVVHAIPLQKLFEIARQDNPEYIVVMDSDAHPIKYDWLEKLTSSLNKHTVLSGVWRDELKEAIAPYIHPSCLCTTLKFIESNGLRFDFIAPNTPEKKHDTLSCFTDKANDLGLSTYKLTRSNGRNFHRLIGGIYGNIIYHHGAGSRSSFTFHDEAEQKDKIQYFLKRNEKLAKATVNLVFLEYENYIAWLRGDTVTPDFLEKMEGIENIEVLESELTSEIDVKKKIKKKLIKNFIKGTIKKLIRI
ncbi:MAG: hypothetical protein QNJ41_09410 [Xenococcaceae cyanobacterium MO_188.B32]|nr:hypothetical protein [Xenococcaceae cyanobacterium MO_188.B32]